MNRRLPFWHFIGLLVAGILIAINIAAIYKAKELEKKLDKPVSNNTINPTAIEIDLIKDRYDRLIDFLGVVEWTEDGETFYTDEPDKVKEAGKKLHINWH